MKISLILTALFALPFFCAENTHADSCADSKFQTPRYEQIMPYRHYQDRDRYNAAPCCGQIAPIAPYWIKTVVVRKERIPHTTTDRWGNERCRRIVATTYKAIYSDGSCRVWTERG